MPPETFCQGTAGHGPAKGYRGDLEVLRAYFRTRDPSHSARVRRSPGGRSQRRRRIAVSPLSLIQQALLDEAHRIGMQEHQLMSALQGAGIVGGASVWICDMADVSCVVAISMASLWQPKR